MKEPRYRSLNIYIYVKEIRTFQYEEENLVKMSTVFKEIAFHREKRTHYGMSPGY